MPRAQITNKKKLFNKLTSLFFSSILAGSDIFAATAPNGVILINNGELSNTVADGNWHDIGDDGIDLGNPVGGPADNFAITYGGDFTIDADVKNRKIQAINVKNHNPGVFRISEDTTIGSIISDGDGNKMSIELTGGQTLILAGTAATKENHGFDAAANTYTGLENINFTGAGGGTITITAGSEITGAIDFLNVPSTTLNFQGSSKVTGSITDDAPDNAHVATINFNGAGDVELGSTVEAKSFNIANVEVKITAVGLMSGNVNFNGTKTSIINAQAGIIGDIAFGDSASIINIGSAGSVSLIGDVSGNNNKGEVNFLSDGNMQSKITNIKKLGIANGENVILTGSMENVEKLVIGDGGSLTIAGDCSVGSVEAENGKLVSVKNLTLDSDSNIKDLRLESNSSITINNSLSLEGNITGTNATFNLSSSGLAYSGTATLTGNTTIMLSVDPANTAQIGQIAVKAGTLDFSGASFINLALATDHIRDVIGNEYVIFKEDGGQVIDMNGITPNAKDDNLRIKWEYDALKRSIKAIDNTGELLPPDFEDVTSPLPGSPYDDFLDKIAVLPEDERDLLWDDLRNPTNTTPPLRDIKEITSTVIDSGIMNSITNSTLSRVNNRVRAMGAGDDEAEESKDNLYSVWLSPLYAKTSQKPHNKVAGYNMKSGGIIVGIDTTTGESKINIAEQAVTSSLIGASITYIDSTVKYKNEKVGDRSKIKSYIFSLYGVHDLPGPYFAQGILSLGVHNIRNVDKRGAPSIGYEYAKVKYKSYSGMFEGLLGYNKQFADDILLTPMVGLRYGKFTEQAHREKDNDLVNISVAKKKYNPLDLMAGAKIIFKEITLREDLRPISIIPEMHLFTHYDLKNERDKISASIEGKANSLPIRVSRPARLSYNIGAGLFINRIQNTSFSADYDLHLARKSKAHQIMLRLSVGL
jgi:outer membrane autotransporter protein